jgi:hypothetical protein
MNIVMRKAQAVCRTLPTAVAQVTSRGICGGRSDIEAAFRQALRFLLPPSAP